MTESELKHYYQIQNALRQLRYLLLASMGALVVIYAGMLIDKPTGKICSRWGAFW